MIGLVMKFYKFLLTTILAIFIANSSYALLSPVPIATEPRIKTVLYSPNEVIKYTGYYGYQSNILFEDGETIGTISMGITGLWQMNPVGNRLFLKPVDMNDATTNVTILTNKRTYFFELHAKNAKDISDVNIPYEVRIVYQDDGSAVTSRNGLDKVPDLESEELNKFNFRYTISGSSEVSPIRIFDDGEFTYFQFHDINADIPAFYNVDKEGNEAIINYRTRGPYIVVERVTARYTLRQGNNVVCVFNEAMNDGRAAKPKKSWFRRTFGFGFGSEDNASSSSSSSSQATEKTSSSWF
jgi:type IV secretion system protein VirB9